MHVADELLLALYIWWGRGVADNACDLKVNNYLLKHIRPSLIVSLGL